jgi:hypothetical protein
VLAEALHIFTREIDSAAIREILTTSRRMFVSCSARPRFHCIHATLRISTAKDRDTDEADHARDPVAIDAQLFPVSYDAPSRSISTPAMISRKCSGRQL